MQNYIEEVIAQFRKKFLWTVHPTETAVPGTKPTTYWNKSDDVDPLESLDFIQYALQKQIEMIEWEVAKKKKSFIELIHNRAIDDILLILSQYK